MEHATKLDLHKYYQYIDFLNKCKIKEYSSELVLHNHHIVPIHLKLNNNDTIKLSVEDHTIAHLLLAEVYDDGTYENLSNLQSARILNGKSVRNIDSMKQISESLLGENNPFYGKSHTTETKSILSNKAREQQTYQTTYELRYGNRADIERTKRKNGVKASWESLTDEQRKIRSKNISNSLQGKMKGSTNGNAHPILVNGIYYGSLSDALEKLKTNRYFLYKKYTIINIKKQ